MKETAKNPHKPAPAARRSGPVMSHLSQVCAALVVFYSLMITLDARGIYFWTLKLPVSEATSKLRNFAESHWRASSRWGLEEPKHSLENLFLDVQDAHPLLYPRKYPEFAAKRKARREASKRGDPERRKSRMTDTRQRMADGQLARSEARGPRVLIVGDSIMMSVGPVIKKDLQSRLGGHGEVIARVATGLSRPDVFDWPRELDTALYEDTYDYVVMMMGTNDSQDFVEEGTILYYGTSDWVKAYNRRVAAMMMTACQGARRAIWVGLPPMKSEAFNRKIIRINSWAKRQAQRSRCVEYVSVDQILGDEQGRYTAYMKTEEGLEKVRSIDGIHVTSRGGELISQVLLTRIASELSMAH